MAKKRIEDIAINCSRSFRREIKKDLRLSKKHDSRNIDVSLSIYEYIENTPGMSRAILADKLGVSQAYLCKLINGNINLTLKTIEKYEEILSIELLPRPKSSAPKCIPTLVKIPSEKVYSTACFSLSFDSLNAFSTNSLGNGNTVQIFCY